MENESRLRATPVVENFVNGIDGDGLEFIENAVEKIKKTIENREYNNDSVDHEKQTRWKRTASDIINDNYVYDKKGCTDLVTVFLAICNLKGYDTNFVKVKRKEGRGIHSIAEVEIEGEWYVVDVGGKGEIKKGQVDKDHDFNDWELWKKGRDSWDLGLRSFDDIHTIK